MGMGAGQFHGSDQSVVGALSPGIDGPTPKTMKHIPLALIALSTILLAGCNKQKIAIDEHKEATLDAIDDRKLKVDAQAKQATTQADVNAVIDKANIEADRTTDQARLDADKKQAEADALAAKARVDAENK